MKQRNGEAVLMYYYQYTTLIDQSFADWSGQAKADAFLDGLHNEYQNLMEKRKGTLEEAL